MGSARAGATVLLISDDERMQRMASWILLEDGYSVSACATTADAHKHETTLAPDVILIDARDLLLQDETRELRAAYPTARIAALHYHGAPPSAHVDAECHLHTPFHADELLQCVADALKSTVGASSTHSHG